MHINRRTNHTPMVNAALTIVLSQSAEPSQAQIEYSEFFNKLCAEKGISHPFELEPDATKDFFTELSKKWNEYKESK